MPQDQAAGPHCCAHVPRQRPSAVTSSFTSLRNAPVRLIYHQGLFVTRAHRESGQPRGLGGRRSEVKEETAAARPASGGMSAGGRPSPAARAAAGTREPRSTRCRSAAAGRQTPLFAARNPTAKLSIRRATCHDGQWPPSVTDRVGPPACDTQCSLWLHLPDRLRCIVTEDGQ